MPPAPAPESAAWLELAQSLGFRVVAPYSLEYDGDSFPCVAMLPDFGSNRGMLIRTGVAQSTFMAAATAAGFRYSHVSIIDCHPSSVADLLSDWGWSGPAAECPSWMDELPTGDEETYP